MRLSHFAAMLIVSLPACASAGAVPLANAGFEELASPGDIRPAAWRATDGVSLLTTAPGIAFEGSRSLRLDFQPPFVGNAQRMDAAPWRGKLLVLRARLKGEGLGQGNAGLWLRADSGEGRGIAMGTSYANPLRGDTHWEPREAKLFVGESADAIVLGATLGAPGTLWVDAMELHAYAPDELPAPSDAARDYLDDALYLIETSAFFSANTDWEQIRIEARAIVAGARSPADTYPAIRLALASLKDGHSRLLPPAQDNRFQSAGGDLSDELVVARRFDRIGYLRIPGFASTDPERGAAFSRSIRDQLESQAREGVCGWIVDLRGNTGGNMYPMIQGLSGLLGKGILGYFVTKDGRTPWRVARDHEGEPALFDGSSAPVAVLQDKLTASSGEATLLSFVGRANTRRFGEASRGLSTANRIYPLADGAALALTTAVMADRSGTVHGGRIDPDELIVAPEAAEAAARHWLEAHSACRD